MKQPIVCVECLSTRADVEDDAAAFGAYAWGAAPDAEPLACCNPESLAKHGSTGLEREYAFGLQLSEAA